MSAHPATGPYAKPPAKQKSYWFRWVCLGLGLVSCVGFIIAASKIQTRKFAVAAVVAVAASAAAFAAVELDPSFDTASTESSETTAMGDVGFGVWLVAAIWAGQVIYALILQPEFKRFLEAEDAAAYARWNASRVQPYAFHPQPTVDPPTHVQSTAPPPRSSAPQEDALGQRLTATSRLALAATPHRQPHRTLPFQTDPLSAARSRAAPRTTTRRCFGVPQTYRRQARRTPAENRRVLILEPMGAKVRSSLHNELTSPL